MFSLRKKLSWSQLRYKGDAKLSQTLVICLELARFNGPRQSERPRLGVRRSVGTYLSVTPSSIMLSASLTSSSQSPQDNLFDDAPMRCKLHSGIWSHLSNTWNVFDSLSGTRALYTATDITLHDVACRNVIRLTHICYSQAGELFFLCKYWAQVKYNSLLALLKIIFKKQIYANIIISS